MSMIGGWRLGIGDWGLLNPQSRNLLLIFNFLFFFILVGCSSVDPVVKVGLVAPFEGEKRAIGYDVIYSARLAVREINEAGGIGGYRVALVALDDRGEVQLAADTAVSLSIDPGVVAVIGNWDVQNTAVAEDVYAQYDLPFIAMGERPFGESDNLPAEFTQAYEAVTPFDETAGVYAGSTYDALQLLWLAMAESEAITGEISREGIGEALLDLQYEGMTGIVSVSE